ncbi:thymidine kinase [Clostridium saccharoperbutylacetonicum]|uniref:thymidine kinase n=1 Tax=Clostridium saccharoperbutylacetonicum TaxID=36745 RepID=UPI0039E9A73F
MSKLYFRYGAMNSGKSTHLMLVAHNYEECGMKIVIMKPKVDDKGGETLVSRLGVKRKVDFLISETDDIKEIVHSYLNKNQNIDCILVDEAQFLKSQQIDELFEIAVKINIPIICYGLRTDFKKNGFEGSTRLLLLAHSIEEMKTICACGKKAIFNGRKINNEFVFEGQQIAIDEQDNVQYESLCGECYYKFKEK